MSDKLKNRKVAILATDGFEQSELTEPREALEKAGAETTIVSLESGEIRGWKDGDWGDSVDVEMTVDEARSEDFDALLLPGGVMNPDKLRRDERALQFVRGFFADGKPVGAICHGPWTLIDAGVISGRKLTSYSSIQTDLKNAGARWVDEEVVVDSGLVTSRHPGDLPAFNDKLVEQVAEGKHAGRMEMTTTM